MSQAKPNPNTPRVEDEDELSLDDLNQIAGGTMGNVPSPEALNGGGAVESMFTAGTRAGVIGGEVDA